MTKGQADLRKDAHGETKKRKGREKSEKVREKNITRS